MIILVGISGSGKTTFAQNLLKQNNKFIRFNRDDFRTQFFGNIHKYFERNDLHTWEQLISNLEYFSFNQAIKNDYKIIFDNTNLKVSYINRWLDLLDDNNIPYVFKFFDCDIPTAVERVSKRDDTIVDIKYIKRQYKNYKEIKKHIQHYYSDKILN